MSILLMLFRIVTFTLQAFIFLRLKECRCIGNYMAFQCVRDIVLALTYWNPKYYFLAYWILEIVNLHWLTFICMSLGLREKEKSPMLFITPLVTTIYTISIMPFYKMSVDVLTYYQTRCYMLCVIILIVGFVLTTCERRVKLSLSILLSITLLGACNFVWVEMGYYPLAWDIAALISLSVLALVVVGLDSDSHTWQAQTL